MTKTKYKDGDKVRIKKPGIFNNLEGEVLETTSSRSLKVSLGQNGTWTFLADDIEIIKTDVKPKPQNETKRTKNRV